MNGKWVYSTEHDQAGRVEEAPIINWRAPILKEFTPQIARLTLVADPDGLLLEEGVLQWIQERGFELIPFEDPIAFRYTYESKFRTRWDRGEHTELVVVLRSASSDLDSLPYDLLQAGRRLCFSLGDLFPHLSYPVVAALDRGDLESLYRARLQHNPGRLGDNATKEFVLRHVFEIAPEFIKQASDLLRILLRRHYRGQRIPALLDERFIQGLRQSKRFEDWPLESIIPDREAFFAFLQERWPAFLDRLAQGGVREAKAAYHLVFPGLLHLPFEHDDIRVYIDSLFLEGVLHPVPHAQAYSLTGTWVGIGIHTDSEADRLHRLKGLMDSIEATIPSEDARHGDWLHFAYRWAELIALAMGSEIGPSGDIQDRLEGLRAQLDLRFTAWVQRRYGSLINLPSVPPVMLHHVPRYLAHRLGESQQERIAFLLVDGLALDQWVALREVLISQRPRLRFRESAIFAWIPTLTAVSRQATFAGKPPIYFPSSIHTTGKESALWKQFWVDQGLARHEVAYMKGLGDGSLDQVNEGLSHSRIHVLGVVIDKVDSIMHGMELGTAGMHNQVRQWARQGFLAGFLDLLIDRGFSIYLASDHGNIEATGCGQPAEGAVADLRGERMRVYPDTLLRAGVKKRFPEAIEWPPLGLPEDYLPLLAPHRLAFVREGKRLVGHGGISVEELVVPLIQIERRET